MPSDGLVEPIPDGPTVEKVRIVAGRNQQVARIDYEEDRDVTGEPEAQIVERIAQLGAAADVLLVSDYLKGTITRTVMETLVALKEQGTPLLVDPKIPHLDCYSGASAGDAEQSRGRDRDAPRSSGPMKTRRMRHKTFGPVPGATPC